MKRIAMSTEPNPQLRNAIRTALSAVIAMWDAIRDLETLMACDLDELEDDLKCVASTMMGRIDIDEQHIVEVLACLHAHQQAQAVCDS
jgi:predicted lipoprotein